MAGRGRGAPRPRDEQSEPRRPRMSPDGDSRVGSGARESSGALVPSRGRGSRRESMEIVNTQTAPGGIKRATFSRTVQLFSNYFELQSRPDFHLYQYHVDFVPDLEFTRARIALVYQHEQFFKKFTFDGSTLYSTTRLEKNPLEAPVRRNDGSTVMVRYRLVSEVFKHDQAYNQVMNTIIRTCLRKLNLVMMRRDYFDPEAAVNIEQHHLSVWPGYVTTIRRYDGGYLMNVEIRHKIVRSDTALDAIKKIYSEQRDSFEQRVRSELVGKIVMTKYNHKTYRIDDVDFDKNPTQSFFIKKEDREITYIEYFQKRWNLGIRDVRQPLLVVRPSRRDINRGDTSVSHLIPELCVMTGLSEQQLNNIRVKNDVGAITRVNPSRRIESLLKFRRRLATTPAIQEELNKWGLNFKSDLTVCSGHIATNTDVCISLGNTEFVPKPFGWSQEMTKCKMANPPNAISKWAFIFPGQLMQDVRSFCSIIKRVCDGLQVVVVEPDYIPMNGDRTSDYVKAIEELCRKDDGVQIVVCVLKFKRADHYQSIKVKTLCEFGILSQVITHRNMTDERKRMSIATKLMIQISAKLGGEPWRVRIPTTGWMIVGYDTYHDARQKKAVGAFVASMNPSFSKYYSKATIHDSNEEIAPNFYDYVLGALRTFYRTNGNRLPQKVIVYRDGVGAGDVARVLEMEVQQIENAIQEARRITNSQAEIGISFVIVSKRINTRFFALDRSGQYINPAVGTAVDNVVTLPERFDFFLVSQNTNQGTVSPTSYNIIRNTANIGADIHQKLAYFMTHLYYNWAGTLSVPAPLQYAHKLAYLCGESLGRSEPCENLNALPYFL